MNFDVPCIKCGVIGCMSLNINGVYDAAAFQCGECDESFGLSDVMLVVESWSHAVEWIKASKDFLPQKKDEVAK